ncbi:hypothetical protein [Actinomadura rudentiformis]|uniref:Uncharacterized protein n=1 Tax=Actinomadura rudentiformis TaxID=359158 RepID=A0A6H9YMA0_9ACTN|nr:hypothetical protein [Actinomadura rudentiformis]KAB2347832.1 hypothetical protein F8566_18235 [Actinomadura rudentiformis]
MTGGRGDYGGFRLDASWPGLEATKDIEIDKAEVERILKELRADYDSFASGNGSLNDMQSRGNVQAAHLGNYPAAQSLMQSITPTQSFLSTSYNSFLTSYEAIITALENAVQGYKDMETNNTASANGVTTGNSSSRPTTGNTQSYA